MVVFGDEDVLGLDIAVHIVVGVEVVHCRANVPKITTDKVFAQLAETELYFFIESALRGILEDHVCCIFVFFVVIVDQLDDVGVVKLMMYFYLILGVFVVDEFNCHHISCLGVACEAHLSI